MFWLRMSTAWELLQMCSLISASAPPCSIRRTRVTYLRGDYYLWRPSLINRSQRAFCVRDVYQTRPHSTCHPLRNRRAVNTTSAEIFMLTFAVQRNRYHQRPKMRLKILHERKAGSTDENSSWWWERGLRVNIHETSSDNTTSLKIQEMTSFWEKIYQLWDDSVLLSPPEIASFSEGGADRAITPPLSWSLRWTDWKWQMVIGQWSKNDNG